LAANLHKININLIPASAVTIPAGKLTSQRDHTEKGLFRKMYVKKRNHSICPTERGGNKRHNSTAKSTNRRMFGQNILLLVFIFSEGKNISTSERNFHSKEGMFYSQAGNFHSQAGNFHPRVGNIHSQAGNIPAPLLFCFIREYSIYPVEKSVVLQALTNASVKTFNPLNRKE